MGDGAFDFESCPECIGLGKIAQKRCPNSLIEDDGSDRELFSYSIAARDGFYPCSGGRLDQPANVIDCLQIISLVERWILKNKAK